MDKCTLCIKDLLEIFLSHSKILVKLRDIFKIYNYSQNINLNSINNAGMNSHSGTFISNNNNNTQFQQNLLFTTHITNNPFNARDSTSSFFSNNLSTNNVITSSQPITSISNNNINKANSTNNVILLSNLIQSNNISNNNNFSQNTVYIFNEEDYFEIIEDSEKLVYRSEEILDYYSNIDFLKFSFYEIISQANEDITTLKSLFVCYQSILSLDAINAISNMLCVRQNLENLKMKFSISNKSFYDIKLYLFYIQFFLDNSHKINFLFKSYFDNKKTSF